MHNILLLLTILFLIPHVTYTMDDPAPSSIPKKQKKAMRKRISSIKLRSFASLSDQDNSHATIPNPAICITPEKLSTDPVRLQRTISALLKNSSGYSEPQSLSQEHYSEPEINLKQPLLSTEKVSNKKRVPSIGLKNIGKSSSLSESPSTSPRKKSSPSHHSHRKLTTSSPYGSPRETKSSHSSPRETTYEDVIEAFNTKSSKIQKIVKYFLENDDNNPNLQDKNTGLTLLHRAVLLHHEKATDLLLCDPRTDSFIEDNNLRKASDFIKDEIITYEKLFRTLKAREAVDLIINALIITNNLLQAPHCPQEFMRQIINAFLEKTLPEILPKYTDNDFFITAIRYRQANQLSLLKDFHKQFKKNLNYQDKLGNTMWHYAAIALDKVLITRLASNPYLDSSIRNKENCIAAQLISSSNNIKTEHLTPEITQKIHYLKGLRTLLFTRDSLEYLCEKEAPMIKKIICPDLSAFTLHKETEEKNPELNPDFIEAKKVIEEGFKIIARSQGDSDLPQETEFPSYAKDDFVYEKLKIKMEAIKTTFSPENQEKLEQLFATLAEDYKQSQLILDGTIKLEHIVIEKKSKQKKDPDIISKPIHEQDLLVSKSSED